MIVIPLKSQYVSLFISFISAASEIVFLLAVLNWNCFCECKALQKGKSLTVRRHLNRTKLVGFTTISIFIIVEILSSFYSGPTLIERKGEAEPCRFLASNDGRENFTSTTFRFSPIVHSCLDADETKIWQNGGNLFEDEGFVVQCSEKLYSFDRETHFDESLPEDHVVECTSVRIINPQEEEIEIELCSFSYRKGNRVTFSELLTRSDLNSVTDKFESIEMWHTDVFFDVSGREREFASRAVFHLSKGEIDEVELRRKVFSTDGEGMCRFKEQVDATEVSSALIYVMVGVWITTLLMFTVSLLFRSHNFFNMSNPLHWAQRAVMDKDIRGDENPVVSTADLEGNRFVLISCSPNSEQGGSGA